MTDLLSAPRAARPSTTVASLGTILGVWAHPDDEAYLSAGVMALARANGQRVVCATATRGEHGTDDPARFPPRVLAELRERELADALGVLGVDEHWFLGYEDGTCAVAEPAVPVRILRSLIDTIEADTVLTFGPDGMTGHPDHIAVGGWADQAAATSVRRPTVLHTCVTGGWAERYVALNERMGVFGPEGPPIAGERELALVLDLDDDVLDRKMAALEAQASQTAGLIAAAGHAAYRRWWSVEAFRMAR